MQRLKLADNPKVALVAVVHARALDVFYIAARTESVVRIAPTVACLDRSAEGIEESKARTQLEATTKAVRKRLPKDADKLWAGLRAKTRKPYSPSSPCAPVTPSMPWWRKHDPVPLDHADQLAVALKLDMADLLAADCGGVFRPGVEAADA